MEAYSGKNPNDVFANGRKAALTVLRRINLAPNSKLTLPELRSRVHPSVPRHEITQLLNDLVSVGWLDTGLEDFAHQGVDVYTVTKLGKRALEKSDNEGISFLGYAAKRAVGKLGNRAA